METALDNPERRLASIAHIVTRGAELYPNRVCIDDLLSGVQLTYAELEERINRLANGLHARGVRRGDFVALMFYNEHAVVEATMALAKLGAVSCPVNVRLLPAETARYVNFHRCRAVIVSEALAERFADAEASLRVVRHTGSGAAPWGDAVDYEQLIAQSPAEAPPTVTRWEDAFRMIQTGGTTGPSKGVVHSHAGTCVTVLSIIAEMGLGRGWSSVMYAPAYHGAGTDWNLYPVLWRGGTVVFPPTTSFSPERFFEIFRSRTIEYLLTVPAINIAIGAAWDGDPIESVRAIVSTSAPTPPAQRRKLREMFPAAAISAGAGISESLNMAFQSPGEFLTEPDSVGEPYLDTRACIVDSEGRVLPAGKPGEICLRGFNTALYYHLDPERSGVTWRKRADDPEGLEWCFTGDIGVLSEDGRLSIVDRSKDVILSGGETIPSVEIEAVFLEHEGVRECAAVGLPDERWGEAVTLVVVKRDAAVSDAEMAAALHEFGRARLASYKLPRSIAFVDALPRSHFGKVLKRDLRERAYPDAVDVRA